MASNRRRRYGRKAEKDKTKIRCHEKLMNHLPYPLPLHPLFPVPLSSLLQILETCMLNRDLELIARIYKTVEEMGRGNTCKRDGWVTQCIDQQQWSNAMPNSKQFGNWYKKRTQQYNKRQVFENHIRKTSHLHPSSFPFPSLPTSSSLISFSFHWIFEPQTDSSSARDQIFKRFFIPFSFHSVMSQNCHI